MAIGSPAQDLKVLSKVELLSVLRSFDTRLSLGRP